MAQLSVVIPVYNTQDYLAWCLASLKAQTFEDIEIVCVNDGSTDASRQILEDHQQRDERIVIIDKGNGGLSSARNAGIDAASADIVCFLDSDDRFVPRACEAIVHAFEANGSDTDVVTFGANCYPKEAGYPWLVEHLSPRDAVYEAFQPALLFEEMSRPFAWRTACKTAFLKNNDLYFNESVAFGEDQVWQFALYPRATKTVLLSDKLYDYRVARAGSLMDRIVHDPYTKMREHIAITAAILSDATATHLLDQYPAHMMGWVAEFLLNETFDLPQDQRAKLMPRIAEMLGQYWTPDAVDKALLARDEAGNAVLNSATAALVLAALSGVPIDDRDAHKMLQRYRGSTRTARQILGAVKNRILRR